MRIGNRRALLRAPSEVQYLLYDAFTTDRAAGAVNGTLSESPYATGGGVPRTVTDTNSKLSIASGLLTFATGGVANGDPGMWYPSQSRVAGHICLAWVTPASSARIAAGFDTGAAGQITDCVMFGSTTLLQVRANTAVITVGSYTASTAYSTCVIQRVAGCLFLAKGGAFTNWTLLWIGSAGTLDGLPAVISDGGSASVGTVDNIRIPVATFIPTPLCFDSFTRADGALGNTETVGPDSQALSALAWQFTSGVWAVATNVAVGTPNTGADVIVNGGFAADTDWTKGAGWTIAGGVGVATASSAAITEANGVVGTWYKATFTLAGFSAGTLALQFGSGANGVVHGANGTYTETRRATGTDVGIIAAGSTATIDDVSFLPLTLKDLFSSISVSTPDVIADVAVTSVASVATQSGVVVNLDSVATPANFVIGFVDRGLALAKLVKNVGGTYTEVISAAITYSAGAVLRVIKSGTSYSLFYNNLAVGAVSTISDVGIVSNTLHSLFSTDSRNSLDAFTLWARGTSNEYATLDLY